MKRTPLRRSGPIGRSKPLKPVNRVRAKKRREECFAKQAALCRTLECCVPSCGWVPYEGHPTHPHHWPTVRRGGKDSDTSPLCWVHHQQFHDHGERAFQEMFEVDVVEEARLLSEQIKERA